MPILLAVDTGCTTIYVPGWAAVGSVLAAAAPRLAKKYVQNRTQS